MVEQSAAPPGRRWLHLPILVTVTFWAAQVPAMHELGQRWDAATLNLLRYSIALVVFSALAAALSTPPAAAIGWRRGLALGGCFGGFGILYTLASTLGDPVAVVTAAALMPVTASLISWAVDGTRPRPQIWRALPLAVPGAILATPVSGASPGQYPVFGLVAILAAQILWSLYSLLLPRWMPAASQIAQTYRSVLWSVPYHLAAMALAVSLGLTHADTASAPALDAGLIIGATLGPLVLGVMLWHVSVRQIGLPMSALYLNLIPVIGTAIAMLFGTVPGVQQLLGAGLVILGMVVAQSRPPG
ncbi:MAG: DMT family transporter [Pseudomonadota bacterium]